MREHLVELVEGLLVLDQCGAADGVEMADIRIDRALVEGFEEGEIFPGCDGDLGGAQLGEEMMEHERNLTNCAGTVSCPARAMTGAGFLWHAFCCKMAAWQGRE